MRRAAACDQLLDLDRLGAGRTVPGLDPAQQQHLGHEPIQPIGLAADGLEQLHLLGAIEPGRGIEQHRCRGADRRRGRAQVVRHRGEEAGPRLLDLRRVAGAPRLAGEPDPVERRGQTVHEVVEQRGSSGASRSALGTVKTSADRRDRDRPDTPRSRTAPPCASLADGDDPPRILARREPVRELEPHVRLRAPARSRDDGAG